MTKHNIILALLLFLPASLQANNYPVGCFIKLAQEVKAYDPQLGTPKGRLPVGAVIKITENKNDGMLRGLYKSKKTKKRIVVTVKIVDLEGSKVKHPNKKKRTPPTKHVRKAALTVYRPTPNTLRAMLKTEGIDYSALNKAMGTDLWIDNNLWDDPAPDLAQRLNWPQESKTNTQLSYRLYAGESTQILGARPFSLALYAQNEYPTYLSMIFANKGDVASLVKNLYTSMREDSQKIEQTLHAVLGEPRTEIFGQGKMKDRVKRWDWKNHAILLAAPKGEYVGIRIMPSGVADAEGKGTKVRDVEIKALLKKRVLTRENGDRLVSQIPMVNQGPKGYCVPATWERYLRYMEIPADMYMLAMAGGTSKGGGTSIQAMVKNTKNLVLRYGRKLKKIDTEFTIEHIKDFIDTGIPIIWIMSSGPRYNNAVNAYTTARKETSWEQWLLEVKNKRKNMPSDVSDDGSHACMITGYNEKTKELAVSDSWGAQFEERWLPIEAAEAATHQAFDIGFPALYIIRW